MAGNRDSNEKTRESLLERKARERKSSFLTRLSMGGMSAFASGAIFAETCLSVQQGNYSFEGASGEAIAGLLFATGAYIGFRKVYKIFNEEPYS